MLLHLGAGAGRPVRGRHRELVTAMASAGICETDPPTPQRAFYGRSLLGSFPGGIPSVAAATPAMVGVVTGGEPLARPDNAERLLTAPAGDKAVVLDTSGVGDLDRLVPLLRQLHAHVRFSLDSAQAAINDRLRPINRRYDAGVPRGEGAGGEGLHHVDHRGAPAQPHRPATRREPAPRRRSYSPSGRPDYDARQCHVQRAPGSVQFRTGGDSPRPDRSRRPVDPVEFRDRR